MAGHDDDRDPKTVVQLRQWPDGTLDVQLGPGVTDGAAALALNRALQRLVSGRIEDTVRLGVIR